MEQMDQITRLNTLGQAGFLAISRQTADRFEDLCKKQLALGLGYLRVELDDVEALFAVTDFDGLAQWNAKRMNASMERLSSAMREQVAAAVEAQDGIGRVVQQQFAAINREAGALADGFGGKLPNSLQPFTEAMGAMAIATNEAIENIAKMGTKLGDELGKAIAGAAHATPAALTAASREAA